MAAKNTPKGLGKGLSALISEAAPNENEGVASVSIDRIKRNAAQPRKNFDKAAITELADSIRVHGIIQPLIVIKEGNDFMIVAGERRYRAAKEAGLKEIPVIVKEFTESELMQVALIENLQREDLNALEEADAYKALMENYGFTQEALSERIGKSRTAIANSLRLINLPEDVKRLIAENKITAGHARAILSLENEAKRSEFARYITEEKLSVRQAEAAAKTYTAPEKVVEKKKTAKAELPKTKDIFINQLEEELIAALSTKVRINEAVGGGGSIVVDYYDNDDLTRLIELLTGEKE